MSDKKVIDDVKKLFKKMYSISKMSELFTGDYNLFNNPMINQAKKALSEEDKQRYKEWGEAVFEDIDYETASVTTYPPPMLNALVYIEESLKSGQHPSTLTEDEKNLLKEMRGEEWYVLWGYVEDDLTDIITTDFVIPTYSKNN